MNRKFKITSLTAAALASLVLASANLDHDVKADDQNDGAIVSSETPESRAQADVSSAESEVSSAQGAVDSASSALSQAQNEAAGPEKAYNDQAAKVNDAKKDADAKQKALNDAAAKKDAAQKLADKATPDAIKKAKQDVTDKNTEISNKQKNLNKSKAKTSDAQKAIDDANNDLSGKLKTLTDKQSALEDADQQVKNAQDALKGTGIAEASEALSNAKNKVNADKSALDKAVAEKDRKNTKKNQTAEALSIAKSNLESATQAAANAKEKYDSDKQASDKALKNKVAKKNQIDSLNQKLKQLETLSSNTINLGDVNKFKKALVDYQAGQLTNDDIAYFNETTRKNAFKGSDLDNEEVDVNNLTDDQVKELSTFAADILNKVRNQLGLQTENDTVTQGSVDFAQKVAKRYQDDFKNGKWKLGWHDSLGINEVADQNGLQPNKKNDQYDPEWQPYEDMSTGSPSIYFSRHSNMNELKSSIYRSLLSMIIPDGHGFTSSTGVSGYEMGHTVGLLGIKMPDTTDLGFWQDRKKAVEEYINNHQNVTHTYNGRKFNNQEFEQFVNDQISKIIKIINRKYTIEPDDIQKQQYIAAIPTFIGNSAQIHFFNISPSSMKENSNFNNKDTFKTYEDQKKEVQGDLETAQSEYSNLSIQADNLAQTAENSWDSLKEANNNVTSLNKDVASKTEADKAAEKELNEASSKEDQINQQLASDQKVQTAAQDRYDTLTASNEEKTKNLTKAQQARDDAQQAVNAAQEDAVQAQNTLTKAQQAQQELNAQIEQQEQALTTAKQDLLNLQSYATSLVEAPHKLEEAKTNENNARAAHEQAQANLETQKTALKKLQPAKDAADAKVAQAQSDYDSAVSALNAAQSRLSSAQAALNEIQHPTFAPGKTKAKFVSKKGTLHVTKEPADKVVTVYNDANGQAIEKTLKLGDKIKTTGYEVINGTKWYKVGKNEWIKEDKESISFAAEPKKAKTRIRLVRNSYVYNKKGKVVRRRGKRYLIKKGHSFTPLRNAKIVKIRGRRFYQIGKNEYIKVVNTETYATKVNIRATIKARKNRKVRAHNSNGRLIRRYVYGKKTYRFSQKKVVKGTTYYKVYGKNLWIKASQLSIKK